MDNIVLPTSYVYERAAATQAVEPPVTQLPSSIELVLKQAKDLATEIDCIPEASPQAKKLLDLLQALTTELLTEFSQRQSLVALLLQPHTASKHLTMCYHVVDHDTLHKMEKKRALSPRSFANPTFAHAHSYKESRNRERKKKGGGGKWCEVTCFHMKAFSFLFFSFLF